MRVIAPASEDLLVAMQEHQVRKPSFFDALLLSTVARSGYTTLFTEDFRTSRELGGATFGNPFLHGLDLASLNPSPPKRKRPERSLSRAVPSAASV